MICYSTNNGALWHHIDMVYGLPGDGLSELREFDAWANFGLRYWVVMGLGQK